MIAPSMMPRSDDAAGWCPMSDASIGDFVRINGGGFIAGAEGVYPEEGPGTKVYVSPFLLQVHEVTNDQFAAFVAATGYVTDAEKGGGSAIFVQTATPEDVGSWWRLDRGATWRTPSGAGSTLEGKGRHPVVHVTLRDARAYAAWAGGRIPTEMEWEYAASLGLFDPGDPESGVRGPDGEARANTWDGTFPSLNTKDDGYSGTAPVGCYAASRIGAHDIIGNVWEWTETPFGQGTARFTIKGGSYLCGKTHCRRYRAAARGHLEKDFSTGHVGFRIVKDV
jgi:formylglycine-generating enzyme required for sulfatase activity